ncbi:tyrosine-protein kinase RYK-like [Styela clava]
MENKMGRYQPPVILLYYFSIFCLLAQANINLYLPVTEVEDLFGADGMELYYIRNGIINQNAISFMAHVQEDKDTLNFMWKATDPDTSVLYDLKFSSPMHSDKEEKQLKSPMHAPNATIKNNGKLPNYAAPFSVNLKCTGLEDGETVVLISLVFRLYDNPAETTKVELKRLKKCSKFKQNVPVAENINPSNDNSNAPEKSNEDGDTNNGNQPKSYDPTHSNSQSTKAFYISISVVTFIIIMAVIIVRIWHRRQRKAEAGTYSMNHVSANMHHNNQFLRPDLPNNETAPRPAPGSNASWMHFTPIINDLGTDVVDIRAKLSAIAVPKSDVVLEEMLQEGTFSRIYRGYLEKNVPVLIKTVTKAASEEQTRFLLFESSLLRGMQHNNLLTIKNVVLDGPEPPLVIFPYTKGGNLKRYLRDIKFNDVNSCGTLSSGHRSFEQASTQDLVGMGIEVACGMRYLAKRGLVHKDLATRNCVIDSNLKVKISDNALSRDLFPADYCCLGDNENRPVRWLAMESLVHKIYSTASDVWSFGVLLWELQSLAAMPYNDIDDFEMSVYLRDGFRLSQPINCPDHLYAIMARCWHYSSDKRPTFSELWQMLMEFNAELGEYV